MTLSAKRIAVFGSTGSIGRNTLEVIASSGGRLRAVALSAHRNFDRLVAQAQRMQPAIVVATDADAAGDYDWSNLPPDCKLLTGEAGLKTIATSTEVDCVVAAIVGIAGLRGTWAALEAGKDVALANKETLVMAGSVVGPLLKSGSARILPIDSEHSAIFQALQSGKRSEVERIILTASGGPFLRHSSEQLELVTVDDALAHPTWEMGPKVTIDSATLMNKALEIIEARWLFDLAPDQIEVTIHPQSVIHSMVEFVDGSVVAQLSPPDMKLPIQYALSYPDRWPSVAEKMDWARAARLEFEPPDLVQFPALQMGYEVARRGGTCGAVINAANEAAVSAFLAGELKFTEIVPTCRNILDNHNFDPAPTLERLFEVDSWARQEVSRWICT